MSGSPLLINSNLCPFPIFAPLAIPISTGSIGFLVDSNSISVKSPGLIIIKELLIPVALGAALRSA